MLLIALPTKPSPSHRARLPRHSKQWALQRALPSRQRARQSLRVKLSVSPRVQLQRLPPRIRLRTRPARQLLLLKPPVTLLSRPLALLSRLRRVLPLLRPVRKARRTLRVQRLRALSPRPMQQERLPLPHRQPAMQLWALLVKRNRQLTPLVRLRPLRKQRATQHWALPLVHKLLLRLRVKPRLPLRPRVMPL